MIVIQLVGVVRIFIPSGSIRQTDSGQQISPICFVNAIQHFHMVGCSAVGGGLGELANVGYPQVGEFYPTNGIAIGGFTVTQVAGIVGITGPNGVTQGVVDRLVIYTSRDIAGIPHAILGSVCKIVLVNVQRASAGGVDGGISHRGGQSSGAQAQTQDQHQTEGRELFQIFHHVQYILSVFKVGCWLRETIWREIAFIVGPIPGMVGVGHSLDLLFFLPE